MVTFEDLRKIAMSFADATEEPHFEKTSFRVKKKIFATYDDVNKRACIKLSEIDQSVYTIIDKSIIYAVDNKWGKQGWTIIEMMKVDQSLFFEALKAAYREVAPKKLAKQFGETEGETENE
jgi:predicted DNA-binding protein (MmcQ/YjbR family)